MVKTSIFFSRRVRKSSEKQCKCIESDEDHVQDVTVLWFFLNKQQIYYREELYHKVIHTPIVHVQGRLRSEKMIVENKLVSKYF